MKRLRRWISICGFEGTLNFISPEKEMHEWLSGGASPCQGEGRGFESRLVLFIFRENNENCKENGRKCNDVLAHEEHFLPFSL